MHFAVAFGVLFLVSGITVASQVVLEPDGGESRVLLLGFAALVMKNARDGWERGENNAGSDANNAEKTRVVSCRVRPRHSGTESQRRAEKARDGAGE